MKTRTLIASIFLPLLGSIPCQAADSERQEIRWVLIHEPSQVVEASAKEFAARVEKETDGRLVVKLLNRSDYSKLLKSGRRVDSVDVMADVETGKVEMCQTYTHWLGGYDHRLWALDLPYLFRDYDHAERVIEGPIGRDLRQGLQAESNLRALAIGYSGGKGVFATTSREIRGPEDLRKLRIVMSPTPAVEAMARQLDIFAIHVPLEAYPLLADNDFADGVEITPARFEELGMERAAKVINTTNHYLLTSMIVMNKKFFESLPPRFRSIVQQAALDVARAERRRSIEANEGALKRLATRGVRIVDLSDEQRARFAERLVRIYPRLYGTVGKDLIAAIQGEGGNGSRAAVVYLKEQRFTPKRPAPAVGD